MCNVCCVVGLVVGCVEWWWFRWVFLWLRLCWLLWYRLWCWFCFWWLSCCFFFWVRYSWEWRVERCCVRLCRVRLWFGCGFWIVCLLWICWGRWRYVLVLLKLWRGSWLLVRVGCVFVILRIGIVVVLLLWCCILLELIDSWWWRLGLVVVGYLWMVLWM